METDSSIAQLDSAHLAELIAIAEGNEHFSPSGVSAPGPRAGQKNKRIGFEANSRFVIEVSAPGLCVKDSRNRSVLFERNCGGKKRIAIVMSFFSVEVIRYLFF